MSYGCDRHNSSRMEIDKDNLYYAEPLRVRTSTIQRATRALISPGTGCGPGGRSLEWVARYASDCACNAKPSTIILLLPVDNHSSMPECGCYLSAFRPLYCKNLVDYCYPRNITSRRARAPSRTMGNESNMRRTPSLRSRVTA